MTRFSLVLVGCSTAVLAVVMGADAHDRPTIAEQEIPPPGVARTPSFVETFDRRPDPARWVFALYDPKHDQPTISKRSLWSNRELQVYADARFPELPVDPFQVNNGVLTIRAAPLSPPQLASVEAAIAREPEKVRNSALRDVRYSSGMLSTRGRFAQLYGYFEIRARWSHGKGIWPAFWLLPQSGKWPPEIDVLEAHGDKPTTVFHSVHSNSIPAVTKRSERPDTGDFHRYGALWTPETIDYFVDGSMVASIATPADMHEPMYLIANLAIGGSWPGSPNRDTPFPAKLEVDYIRAWPLAPGS